MMLYCKLSLSERENIATHFIFKSLRGSLRGKLKSIKRYPRGNFKYYCL